MKICAIICEFNPFHNGHEYLLKQAREVTACDFLICVMSGSFTQRGEMAIADKFTRAKHAVSGGADCVLELPVCFSVAPAEVFAKGAVKLVTAVPSVTALAFGSENGDKGELFKAAELLNEENPLFKTVLYEQLKSGQSYIKSYLSAFSTAGGDPEILKKPNNVLAIEYIKAIRRTNREIEIYPVKRVGADYNDGLLKSNYSSASAIRKNVGSRGIENNVPPYVFEDLTDISKENELYEKFLKLTLSRTSAEDLRKTYGCGEGLENTLKNLENLSYGDIIAGATSKRYTSSRIKRILCSNFLGLRQKDCEDFLNSDLYLTPLAVKKQSADAIFAELSKSKYPLITSKTDLNKLDGAALKCKNLDDFAYAQRQQIFGTQSNRKMIIL